jgi:hypothetical protein
MSPPFYLTRNNTSEALEKLGQPELVLRLALNIIFRGKNK